MRKGDGDGEKFPRQSNNGFPLADYTTQNLIQVRPLNNRESDEDDWTFGNLTVKYAAPFGTFIESATYFHRYSRDTEDGSIDWNQLQQSILLACSFHVTENVGSAVSKGGELEVDGSPLPGLYLNLNLGLGYEDAAITSAPVGAPLTVGCALNGVPRWTGSLLGDYSFPMSFGNGFVRGQYTFTGSSVRNNNPVSVFDTTAAGRERGSYSLVNLFVGGKHESWEASLLVKNLCDVRGNLGDEQSEISELPGRPRWMVTTPRTVGIDVKKQF
jgi:iron complex outermembrane receptor protein